MHYYEGRNEENKGKMRRWMNANQSKQVKGNKIIINDNDERSESEEERREQVQTERPEN